ncbi:methyltransferase domain-containing protein [archaeon]|jgi:SAM-dependent methyltransferase|nr:methyltransferase domain-containing protein [archaeon]MBT3731239.1 methyltransferase domain-containing protein [archaeon]MBT4670007.1 methyltransferase domain-containing protein [archaeon]MBT5287791.1 methyltransferase domain-containing protein [archaeon]MBT7052796.1 methyltransferase domain-containing protein [archaeon]
MEALNLEKHSLDDRFVRIVREHRRIPDLSEMREVPYYSKVLDSILEGNGSYQKYTKRFEGLIEIVDYPFPSREQLHTMAAVVENKRIIIGDAAGARKTAPAMLAKFGIEEEVGEKVKTVIAAPGYIINNWIQKLDQYVEEDVNYCVITPEDKWGDLRQAAREDMDFVFVSYDLLFRELKGEEEEEVDRTAAILNEIYKDKKQEALEYLKQIRKEKDLSDWGIDENSGLEDICLAAAFENVNGDDNGNDRKTVVGELINILTKNDPDELSKHQFYFIGDEFHNVRSVSLGKKTNAFYHLASRAEYISLLSGTIMPDNIGNLAVVASILEPENYPEPRNFIRTVGNNPAVVRRFLEKYEKKPVHTTEEVTGVKQPEIKDQAYILNENEWKIYQTIQADRELSPIDKLLLQSYVSLDARLIKPENFRKSSRLRELVESTFEGKEDLLENLGNPSRYEVLEDLIIDIPNGEKYIIFSNYTKGVTGPVTEFLRDMGSNVVVVDQSVSSTNKKIRLRKKEINKLEKNGEFRGQKYRIDLRRSQKELLDLLDKPSLHYSERDKVILEFQTNPDIDGIVTTFGTLREGRDLYAGNHIVMYDWCWIPGVLKQAIARAARSGQKKECYATQIRATATVEDGKKEHVRRKEVIIREAERCENAISKEDAASLAGLTPKSSEREIRPYLLSPWQLARKLLGKVNGGGIEAMEKLVASGYGGLLAINFNYNWETSLSADRGKIVSRAMDHLGLDFKRILELGAGPAQMARTLRRNTTVVDYLEDMIEIGKIECKKLGIDIDAYQGSVHKMPFLGNRSYDFAVGSNILNILSQGIRPPTIAETRRVLEVGGHASFVFPPSAFELEDKETERRILENLVLDFERAGFDINDELTGRYKITETIEVESGKKGKGKDVTHFLLVGENSDRKGEIENGMFELKLDHSYSDGDGELTQTKVNKEEKEDEIGTDLGEVSIGFQNIDTGLVLEVEKENSMNKFRELIRKLVESGQVKSEEEAHRIMANAIRGLN